MKNETVDTLFTAVQLAALQLHGYHVWRDYADDTCVARITRREAEARAGGKSDAFSHACAYHYFSPVAKRHEWKLSVRFEDENGIARGRYDNLPAEQIMSVLLTGEPT